MGDSRVYHVRAGQVIERTRDHSHVELLVREGLISAGQMQTHPLRNFVESCLGGDSILPEMTLESARALLHGDVLLVCTDGFWAGLEDADYRGRFPRRRYAAARSTALACLAGADERRGCERQHLGRGAALSRLTQEPSLCMSAETAAAPICSARCVSRATSPRHAEGSVLVEFGDTRVLCTASVEEGVPPFLRGKGQGWVTAEYGMLPRSTHTRSPREAARGKQTGRTQEIQRLIGRSLRAAMDLAALGERTVTLDCDVLQADGGTRTAAITGGFVALADACEQLLARRLTHVTRPLHGQIAAVSVGIVRGERCSTSITRGQRGRDRHERRHEQRRRLRRGAGYGRGPRLPPARVRRAAQSGGQRHRRSCARCRPRRSAPSRAAAPQSADRAARIVSMQVVLATANPASSASSRRCWRRCDLELQLAPSRASAALPETGDTLRGQCRAKGAPCRAALGLAGAGG